MSIDLKEIIHGGYTEKEIRKAFTEIASTDLVNHLEAFICSQDTTSRSVKMLSRKLALSISPKCLTSEHLQMFIKYQESEDEDVRWLAIDLASNVLEEILLENLPSLIDYQESDDNDVRTLTNDLALSIDPDKLIDKLDFLEQKLEESRNQLVSVLITKLIENATAVVREDKVAEIINMIIC